MYDKKFRGEVEKYLLTECAAHGKPIANVAASVVAKKIANMSPGWTAEDQSAIEKILELLPGDEEFRKTLAYGVWSSERSLRGDVTLLTLRRVAEGGGSTARLSLVEPPPGGVASPDESAGTPAAKAEPPKPEEPPSQSGNSTGDAALDDFVSRANEALDSASVGTGDDEDAERDFHPVRRWPKYFAILAIGLVVVLGAAYLLKRPASKRSVADHTAEIRPAVAACEPAYRHCVDADGSRLAVKTGVMSRADIEAHCREFAAKNCAVRK